MPLRSPLPRRSGIARLSMAGALAALLLPTAPPAAADDDPPGYAAAGAYLAARQAMGDQDFAAATPFLDRVLRVLPDDAQVMENLLVARMALGDLQGALEPAEQLRGIDSQAGRLVRLAALMAEGSHAEVLEALDGGEGLGALFDPLLRGWTLIALGRMSDGLAAFEEVGRLSGMDVFGLYHTALALALAGDAEGAEAILSGEAAGPLRLTRRGFEARAIILSQLDRNDEAEALLAETFGDDPDLAPLRAALAEGLPLPFSVITEPRDGMAEVFYDVAGALYGDAGDAFTLTLSRVAEVLRPDHVPARLLSAQMLAGMGQYDLAVAAFSTVSPDEPGFVMAEIGRADALHRSGEADAAQRVLEALADSHPQFAIVHITLGDLLRRERQFDAASRAYDTAMDLLGPPQPQHWSLHFSRAITHEREGRWPEAEADFRKALELNPDQPHVLNYLGYSLVERRENLDEALDMIRRAVAAQPNSGHIVDSLGWAYYRLGRFDEALEHMERAVELLPTDPILNDHLGDVFWALGRKREARFQWERALSLGPAEDLDMDRIRRKLEVGLDAVLIEEGAEPHHPTTEARRGH
ncbi:MAG: tetratricopeptide repeat protein [Alkalilacustris sp.]